MSGCHHARLIPRQTRQIVESGRATIARVLVKLVEVRVSKECICVAPVDIGSGRGVSKSACVLMAPRWIGSRNRGCPKECISGVPVRRGIG